MNNMRSYVAYIAPLQKLLQFVLVPLGTVLTAVGMQALKRMAPGVFAAGAEAFFAIASFYLLYLAVICDVFFERDNFGGTFSSRASYLEYMKTSPRGLSFYGQILTGSVCVRFLYALCVPGLFCLIGLPSLTGMSRSGGNFWLFFAGALWLAMQTGALFTRFFAAQNTALVSGMVSSMVIGMLFMVVSLIAFEKQNVTYTVAGVLAIAAGWVLAFVMVRTGMRKKEREYVDC